MSEVKTCARCGEEKPVTDFYRSKQHKDGYGSYCKVPCERHRRRDQTARQRAADPVAYLEKWRGYRQAHYARHPERMKEKGRKWGLKSRFGITQEQYEQMLAAQGGHCAICLATEPTGGRIYFSIDHDRSCCPTERSCGKCIRGLLCNHCNSFIGLAKDDPVRLLAAVRYLNLHAIKEAA